MANSAGRISIYPPSYRVSTSSGLLNNFTYEVQIISNGSVSVTTGQLAAVTQKIGTYNYYNCPTYNDNLYVAITESWTDGRPITVRFIMRIGGTTVNTVDINSFSFPSTSKITLSHPTTVQTGAIISASISGIQVNSNALLDIRSLAYSRDNGSGGRVYNAFYGYINNGLTVIQNYALTSVVSSFTYYVPYYSNWTHDYNDGILRIVYTIDTSTSFTNASEQIYLDYTNITWSYINQSDSNAGPIITLHAVTCTPSNILTKYGKYVGGGITQLAFGWDYQCKYGSSFQSVQYQLYSSGGTLINTWTYNSVTALSLSLTNTSDASYYVRVTITASNGASNAVNYSTFDVYGYSYPYIRKLEVRRCNQDGTANDSGAYCITSWSFKVIPLGNINAKTVVLTAPDGSHTFTNEDYDNENGYYYISVADIEHSYAVSLSVTDDFQSVSKTVNLSTAGVIMDFLYDGKGIGLGKVAETTEMVEVNPQWTFKADKMTFKGQDLETILTSLGYVFPT